MIFGTLLLWGISFIMTALLTPPPKIENARAEDLDPDSFPKATEDSPIPLLLGKAWIEGPNTIWYGNYKAVPVTEKIKINIFKSKKVIVGYKYYLSIDLALCLGPVSLHDVEIDDVKVMSGSETEFKPLALEDTFSTNYGSLPTTFTEITSSDFDIDGGDISGADLVISTKISMTATLIYGGDPVYCAMSTFIYFYGPGDALIGTQTLTVPGTGAASVEFTNVPIPHGTVKIKVGSSFSLLFPIFTNVTIVPGTIKIYGTLPKVTTFEIYEPELFGGKKQGGGWIGDFTFYPGTLDQPISTYLETQIGVGEVPAYNGVSHIVFEDNYIGESPNLRAIAFLLSSYVSRFDIDGGPRIGDDLNPVEAIGEIIVNPWRGLGKEISLINAENFKEIGNILKQEKNGVSLVVSSGQTGKEVISEILRQIDGMMYQDPESLQFNLKLIRRDYDADDLPFYDESDIIDVTSYSKTTWEDIYAQVKVSYSSLEKDSNKTAVAQDMAVFNMKGDLKTASYSFPMCYNDDTANALAARELSQICVPLFKMTVEMNRNGKDLKIGDPFKMSYPEYGLYEVIVRVQEIDLGELLNNKIILEVVQDTFAVADVVLAPPTDSAWQDYERIPPAVTEYSVEDLPYYFFNEFNPALSETNGYMLALPAKPSLSSTAFSVFADEDDVQEGSVQDPDSVTYPPFLTLKSQMLDTDGFLTGTLINYAATFTNGLSNVDYPDDQYGLTFIYVNGEFMMFDTTSVNIDGDTEIATLYRGVLGSTPKTHPIGSKMYFFNEDIIGDGDMAPLLISGDDMNFKIQNISVNGARDIGRDVQHSFTSGRVFERPVRPRNLNLSGSRVNGEIIYSASPTRTINWLPSDRRLFANETEAAQTPDNSETYVVHFIVDGSLAHTIDPATSGLTFDFNTLTGNFAEVRVFSKNSTSGMLSKSYAWIRVSLGENILLLSGDFSGQTLLSGDAIVTSGDALKLSGGS